MYMVVWILLPETKVQASWFIGQCTTIHQLRRLFIIEYVYLVAGGFFSVGLFGRKSIYSVYHVRRAGWFSCIDACIPEITDLIFGRANCCLSYWDSFSFLQSNTRTGHDHLPKNSCVFNIYDLFALHLMVHKVSSWCSVIKYTINKLYFRFSRWRAWRWQPSGTRRGVVS
jgi:hypothetical protein